MKNKIEQEEQLRREQFEQQQNATTSVAQSPETGQIPQFEEDQRPTTLKSSSTNVEASNLSTISQMENPETTTEMEERASFPIRPSEESEQLNVQQESTTVRSGKF